MALRVWWVSVVTVLAVPALVGAKDAVPALVGAKDAGPSARGARRTANPTRLVRTHPLSEAVGNRPRTGAGESGELYAEWDPLSEAIWGSLVADAPRRAGERTLPARGADVVDGSGSADFPLCSPHARGARHRISLRDSHAPDRRGGSPYDGILERMRADRAQLARLEASAAPFAGAAPSARLDATVASVAEEAPWFGSAPATQMQQRSFFTRSTVDSRDVTPVREEAPVGKELRDDAALAPADAEQAEARPATGAPAPFGRALGHALVAPSTSSTALPTALLEASGFPGHQSGMIEWVPGSL